MTTKRFVERNKIVSISQPADAGAAAIAPKFASVRNYGHSSLFVSVGAAADAPVLQIRQAQNIAGTGIKHLIVDTYYVNTPASSPQDEEDMWHEVTGGTGVVTLAANTNYLFDIRPAMLDVDNDFDCVGAEVEDPGAGANDIAIALILQNGPGGIVGDNRHQPSARVNKAVN
jgi:hypothetical protein